MADDDRPDDASHASHENRNIVSRNNRPRFGQLRAQKRCIIEYKRSSSRHPRSKRTEVESQVVVPRNRGADLYLHGKYANANKEQDSVMYSTSRSDERPRYTESVEDHKRPRSETQPNRSNFCNPSLPIPVAGRQLYEMTRDGAREFICKLPLLDRQRLDEYLSKETHYYPNNSFLYYVIPEIEDKVDAALRNTAVQNLHFIHNAYFGLSSETFCKAVNLVDRFIVKVKVKPKYIACVATASYCAASKLCNRNEETELPSPEKLVQITRCGGNAADLIRMEEILSSKLGHDLDGVTTFDFLCAFVNCIVCVTGSDAKSNLTSAEGDAADAAIVQPDIRYHSDARAAGLCRSQLFKRLMTRLEISLCSLEIYRFRPACVALGILAQTGVKQLAPIANLCGVNWADVIECATLIEVLYEVCYRDPLLCGRRSLLSNYSRRALFRIGHSSPTPLDTITEDYEPTDGDDWMRPLLTEP